MAGRVQLLPATTMMQLNISKDDFDDLPSLRVEVVSTTCVGSVVLRVEGGEKSTPFVGGVAAELVCAQLSFDWHSRGDEVT